MSGQDTASLVRAVYTAYNDRAFDKAAELVTDDYEWRVVGTEQTFKGKDGMRQYLQGWATGFPDSKVEVTNLLTSGNHAVVELTGRGVHSGVLKTPMGDIPATGKRVELHLCDIYEVSGGKIRRGRTYFDTAALLRQLGITS